MSVKNVKIRFNLEKENDRKAYDYLQNAEKSYSKAVISAICGYMELSEKAATEAPSRCKSRRTDEYHLRCASHTVTSRELVRQVPNKQ